MSGDRQAAHGGWGGPPPPGHERVGPAEMRPRVPGAGRRRIELNGQEIFDDGPYRHSDGRVSQYAARKPPPRDYRLTETAPPVLAEDEASGVDFSAMSDIGKRKVGRAERERLARAGHALSDGSYPIANEHDLENAAAHVRMGHGDVSAARRLIAQRAKDLGVPNPLNSGRKFAAGVVPAPVLGRAGRPALPAWEPTPPRDWASAYLPKWERESYPESGQATHQPQPVPGEQRNAPGNHPVPRGDLAESHPTSEVPPGGDPHDPGRVDTHFFQQQIRPVGGAELATVHGSGPIASSIGMHQGKAVIDVLDQARASWPAMNAQLGRNAPAGITGAGARGDFGAAEIGYGQVRGETPQRPAGAAYGQVPKAAFQFLTQKAPGE